MKYLLKGKKGVSQNVGAWIIFLFSFAFISIIGYVIYDNFMIEATSAGLLDTQPAQKAKAGFDNAMNAFDYVIFFMAIIGVIMIALTSYIVATPPVFFLVTFIMASFLGLFSAGFNYAFSMFISDTTISTVTNHFPLTIILCTNLHWVSLLLIIVGSITLYAKRDKGQYV